MNWGPFSAFNIRYNLLDRALELCYADITTPGSKLETREDMNAWSIVKHCLDKQVSATTDRHAAIKYIVGNSA
jgi:hypothetical protein